MKPSPALQGNTTPISQRVFIDPIHADVLQFCFDALDLAEFVTPTAGDARSDRMTSVVLPAERREEAADLKRRYQQWLGAHIASCRDFLSAPERNQLLANALELAEFIEFERRSQDTGPALYKSLYRIALEKLIEQQEHVCALIKNRQQRPNMARRRSYWVTTPLTLGVEEEHQIVSTETWELAGDVNDLLEGLCTTQFGREVYRSQVELNTGICDTVSQAEERLRDLRAQLVAAMPEGLALVAAGTHPFSTWNTQHANQTARTELFMHDMQDAIRRLVTFGVHVHVGVDCRELALEVMRASRRFLPMLLAISASSPFWEGRVTGLSSYRSTVFSCLPRTGIPPDFDSAYDFNAYLELLAATNSFDSAGTFDPTKLWWDVRVHPQYPTVEFRICDACTTVADTVCVAALCQALVAKIAKLYHSGLQMRPQSPLITAENKWRAARHGVDAKFIDDWSQQELTARYALLQLMDFVDDVVDDLGSRAAVERALAVIEDGGSAQQQQRIYGETRDFGAVLRRLSEQFLA